MLRCGKFTQRYGIKCTSSGLLWFQTVHLKFQIQPWTCVSGLKCSNWSFSPVAPQRLMTRIWLDEISAELDLLMEELRRDVFVVIVIRCGRRALSVGLMAGADVPLCSQAQLSGQGLEQMLTVVEAAVIWHVHGHPESSGGQLIMQNLQLNVTECYIHMKAVAAEFVNFNSAAKL